MGRPDQLAFPGDLGQVVESHQPLIGDAVLRSGPGFLLVVEKLPWSNTLDVTRAVEAKLSALRAGLPGATPVDGTGGNRCKSAPYRLRTGPLPNRHARFVMRKAGRHLVAYATTTSSSETTPSTMRNERNWNSPRPSASRVETST